jgi:uncharacterized protein GlcG (DUF336 family)
MKPNQPISVLLLSSAIGLFSIAQAAIGPFGDKPESPRSLPADNLPPFRMLDAQGDLVPLPALPPGGLHHEPGGAPESTARSPSLALALEAAQTAIESCRTKGYRIGVAVIDSSGEARAMITADGADGSHVFVAMRKALTALATEMPSGKAADLVGTDKALLARIKPNMFVMGGALPIVVNHQTIGAIGVSGAAGMPFGHQDEVCAAAGLTKIQNTLK